MRRLPGHVAHTAQEGGRQQARVHRHVLGRRADEAAQDVLHVLALGVGGQRGLDLRRQRGQGLRDGVRAVRHAGGRQVAFAGRRRRVVVTDARVVATERDAVLRLQSGAAI